MNIVATFNEFTDLCLERGGFVLHDRMVINRFVGTQKSIEEGLGFAQRFRWDFT